MELNLIYHTPAYPKLVESLARLCYQSEGKCTPTSHKMIKSIMKKGHLSIAGVGNIVFKIEFSAYDSAIRRLDTLKALMEMKVINNYIRWSFGDYGSIFVSMNILTFMEIKEKFENKRNLVYVNLMSEVDLIPELRWFYDDNTEVPINSNMYVDLGKPDFYKPILFAEDYTALKEHMTEAHLDIHATFTLNFMTDRSTGLQNWRHADMCGGTELSQRYVNRADASFRVPEADEIAEQQVREGMEDAIKRYTEVRDGMIERGFNHGRAKEVARALLGQGMSTIITNCRPLRQWKHYMKLRISPHAQLEIQHDTVEFKKLFTEVMGEF